MYDEMDWEHLLNVYKKIQDSIKALVHVPVVVAKVAYQLNNNIIIFNFYIALNTNVSKRFTNILLPRSLDSVLTRTQCGEASEHT